MSRREAYVNQPLSHREVEVLAWCMRGLKNTEIADKLVLSVATVSCHWDHIHWKLGSRTMAHAVVLYLQQKADAKRRAHELVY